jgi:hypothetical protein
LDGLRRGTPIKKIHTHARHRKRKNFIAKLVADSVVYTSHEDKARAVDVFYSKLLGITANREHSVDLQVAFS